MDKPKPIPEPPAIKATCVVCGQEKLIRHSLRLTRDNGSWKANPACGECRIALIKEAKSSGRFLPFFPIIASLNEMADRNGKAVTFRSFLDRFGRSREDGKARQSQPNPKRTP